MFSAVLMGWINFAMQMANSVASALYRYIAKYINLNIIIPVVYVALNLILGILVSFTTNVTVCITIIIIFVTLMSFLNDPFKIATRDFIRKNLPEKSHHMGLSIFMIIIQTSQVFYSFLIGSLLAGITVSKGYIILASLAYVCLLLTFAGFSIIYLDIKRKRNGEQSKYQLILEILSNKNF